MRKLGWIIIAGIWLLLLGYLGVSYFKSPSKEQYRAVKAYVAVSRLYVNNKDIDLNSIEGEDPSAQYVKLFAAHLQKNLDVNRELAKQRNFLIILVQPRSLASPQSIDVSLERVSDFDKAINDINTDRETTFKDIINKVSAIDHTKIKYFDIVKFAEYLQDHAADRQKEIQQYVGLSQYVRSMLQFVKSRIGYYQLTPDGNNIIFTRPVDQDYYTKLQTGISQYIKTIDDINAERISIDRKDAEQLPSVK